MRVLSGEDRSLGALALRCVLRTAEPFYAATMFARNALYDAGVLKSHRLPRPTIAVGNITTGGTGKTPMVRWLAEQLVARGLRPAILMRGYRGESTGGSDEARMLADYVGDRAIIIANPDRVAGAAEAMKHALAPNLFLLDDAFQHRRVRRDFDLVLINAAEPFGYGHVLPRGLMREAPKGLARADAFVITHSSAANATTLDQIISTLRKWNPHQPIYRADHVLAALRMHDDTTLPIDALRTRRFFGFCGIAGPQTLRAQLESFVPTFAGLRAFGDHHGYSADDLRRISAEASALGAELLVTTEKDWVKAKSFVADSTLPIATLKLQIHFRDGGDEALLRQITETLSAPPPDVSANRAQSGRAS